MRWHHKEDQNERTRFARELRKAQTEAERALWSKLRGRQLASVKFRRQEPIGPYIVDFVSYEAKLIIELDGGQHNEPAAQGKDCERTRLLKEAGFHVIRFWNTDVLSNLEGVLARIQDEMGETGDSPSPKPSPIEGEGTQLPHKQTRTLT